MTIRVAVADDQAIVRDGLRVPSSGWSPTWKWSARLRPGSQAVALARQALPDVLLMDVRMPELDGIEATRQVCADPETDTVKVLILTTFDEDEQVYSAIRAGASGFLLKDVTAAVLHDAIRSVAAGDAVIAPAATRRLLTDLAQPTRTPGAPGTRWSSSPRGSAR